MRKVGLGCRMGRGAGGPSDSVQSRDAMWACLIFVPEQLSMFRKRKKKGKKKKRKKTCCNFPQGVWCPWGCCWLGVEAPGGRGPSGSLLPGSERPGRVCGWVPASPAGVSAREVRQKQEKRKPSVHFPRPVALFSPPASFPSLGGFLVAPAWVFQQEVNSRTNPSWKLMGAGPGGGGGVAREAEPARRGQETGWGEGHRPHRPVGSRPAPRILGARSADGVSAPWRVSWNSFTRCHA